MEITAEQLDRIGRLGDKADNYIAAVVLNVAPRIHIEGLLNGMNEIRAEAQALYRELGGEE